MEPRPVLLHQATSHTLAPETPSVYGGDNYFPDVSVPDEPAQATSHPSPSIHDDALGVRAPLPRVSIHDMFLLAGIFVMLAWPWIFLGAVWGLKGVQMSNHVARFVTAHPHGTAFFITLLGNTISLIVSILFSFAIIRFAQEWVTSNREVTAFDISVLAAFRHQNWPWGMEDLKHPVVRNRWLPVALVGGCIGAFAFVPASTTSLITPVQFIRTAPLTGPNLEFSSSATDCLEWFDAKRISNNSDWQMFKGLNYTDCLGVNQMVDVLESSRGNTTHTQLIYSTNTPQPESCDRTETGSVSYLVIGWFAAPEHIGFLMPMTIVNLASLIVLLMAMFNAKSGYSKFDPLKPNSLLAASCDVETGRPIDWQDKVKYRPEVINPQLSNGAQELRDQVVDALVSAASG